jgi:hypothetical protein
MAKRWVFLPTTHMLPPHIKRKKCKKKFYFLPHENTTHRREKRDATKKEKRKKRKEEKEDHGAERPATETLRWVSPAVGLRDPRYFFSGDLGKDLAGRMKPTVGSCRKDLARDQTPRDRPTGHQDPRLGLAVHGFGFFCFCFSFQSDFFFFLFLG